MLLRSWKSCFIVRRWSLYLYCSLDSFIRVAYLLIKGLLCSSVRFSAFRELRSLRFDNGICCLPHIPIVTMNTTILAPMLFVVLALSSCVFYVPLREREAERGWVFLEQSEKYELSASGGVSFHNDRGAVWAVRTEPTSMCMTVRQIMRAEVEEYQSDGWRIFDQDLFSLPHSGIVELIGVSPTWHVSYRRTLSDLSLRVG